MAVNEEGKRTADEVFEHADDDFMSSIGEALNPNIPDDEFFADLPNWREILKGKEG